MSTHSIVDCLISLGFEDSSSLESCESLDDEFKAIKRTYFAKILREHPDKGGDADIFRNTQAAFEVIRELYQKQKVRKGTFGSYFSSRDAVAEGWDNIFAGFGSSEVPSYEHFAEAAEEEVPGYFVELARSGRSHCVVCKKKKQANIDGPRKNKGRGKKKAAATSSTAVVTATSTTTSHAISSIVPANATFIPKGHVRVGSLDEKSGTYGRWSHLTCWRVPSRVWSGLTKPDDADTVLSDLLHMDEVLLTGLTDLASEDQQAFVQHVMDKSFWAKKIKRKKKIAATAAAPTSPLRGEDEPAAKRTKTNDDEGDPKPLDMSTSNVLTKTKHHFIIPRPGKDGALGGDHLEGRRFVLTGVFPEIGGGQGINMGKDKVKKMIESFGGKVTSAVSGKTSYVIVGKNPGASKVNKARNMRTPLIDLRTLQQMLTGITSFEEADGEEPPRIEAFSAGYSAKRIGYY